MTFHTYHTIQFCFVGRGVVVDIQSQDPGLLSCFFLITFLITEVDGKDIAQWGVYQICYSLCITFLT